MKFLRKLVSLTALALLATTLSVLPGADTSIERLGIDSVSVQPADAATKSDVFWCSAVGASGGIFGGGGALITTVAVAFICGRTGRGADAICAEWMRTKIHKTVYGNRVLYYPQGKYYQYGKSTCAKGDWQYSGGVYGAGWKYVR